GDDRTAAEGSRATLRGEDVVALDTDERVLLKVDVTVSVEHVLSVLVVVVAVALLHIAGRRGGGDGLDVVVVAADVTIAGRAGIDVRSNGKVRTDHDVPTEA